VVGCAQRRCSGCIAAVGQFFRASLRRAPLRWTTVQPKHHLTPLVDAIEANLGKKPEQVSADAGYLFGRQSRGVGETRG
jgi:hypothetical protein